MKINKTIFEKLTFFISALGDGERDGECGRFSVLRTDDIGVSIEISSNAKVVVHVRI